jgi:hypothetical protein
LETGVIAAQDSETRIHPWSTVPDASKKRFPNLTYYTTDVAKPSLPSE